MSPLYQQCPHFYLQSKFTFSNSRLQNPLAIFTWMLYQSISLLAIRTAMTKDCKPGELTEIYCLKLWRQKCLKQDASRIGLLRIPRDTLVHASPIVPACLLAIFGFSWCEAEWPALFLQLQVAFSGCMSMPKSRLSPFYKHFSHTGLGTHHTPLWSHLN